MSGPLAAGAADPAAIAPFLPGLEEALADEEVSEIMINGPGAVWVESGGRLRRLEAPALDAGALGRAALQIVRPLGIELNRRRPCANARLGDGSRVAVAIPPAAAEVTITIRRFGRRQFTAGDLIRSGSLPYDVAGAVLEAMESRRNVLVAGATGAGKTTMLGAFCSLLPLEDRVLVIEDTMEIRIAVPNCVRFEARGGVSIRDLVREALRHRPDRIVVGEVRGGEAADLLDALATGHGGSLSTIHASSAEGALRRLATCVLQAEVEGQSWAVVCRRVLQSVDLVVHVSRERDGSRGVREAAWVRGWDDQSDAWDCERIWPAGAAARPPGAAARLDALLAAGEAAPGAAPPPPGA